MTKCSLSGAILGACNCDWGCPCNYDARPTKGHCDGVYVLAIRRGNFVATKLDGLHAMFAGSFPGAVHEGNGTSIFVIDERANPESSAVLAQMRERVQRAVSDLSPDDRLLLQLRFEQDLTLDQLARLLDLGGAQRVDRRIREILACLREELDGRRRPQAEKPKSRP